jgi:sporulation protein YqfC
MMADLPDEPEPGLPLVEIIGHGRILIENHKGVTEYGKELIRVKVKNGSVCVCGKDLELARMHKGVLIISGNIENIQLCRG